MCNNLWGVQRILPMPFAWVCKGQKVPLKSRKSSSMSNAQRYFAFHWWIMRKFSMKFFLFILIFAPLGSGGGETENECMVKKEKWNKRRAIELSHKKCPSRSYLQSFSLCNELNENLVSSKTNFLRYYFILSCGIFLWGLNFKDSK